MKLTQEELAERAELHHTYIGQVERGEKNLTLTTLERIVNTLGVSYSELFGEIGDGHDRNSISALCYELINRQDAADQERIYRILCELEQMGNQRK